MIRVVLYDVDSGRSEYGGEGLLQKWRAEPRLKIWVDFSGEEPVSERRLLSEVFEINDLALDDCQRDRHPPKLEWFDDYFFLLLKGFTAETKTIDYDIVHISFFVGPRFLVTRHALPSPSINKVWDLQERQSIIPDFESVHLCYRIVRTIIDRYTPIIMNLEERLDELEEEMVEDPSDKLLAELTHYKSRLKKLRRIFGSQSAVMADLKNSRGPMFDDDTRHEINDIHEHMDRLASLTSLLQELAVDLMESYISLTSHRLNRIMKVLTITAVIFLPLTLLAGIYGMNFEYIPELGVKYGYFIVVAIMIAITLSLLALFRYVKWL